MTFIKAFKALGKEVYRYKIKMANRGQIEDIRRYYNMEKKSNCFKDMEEKELKEQYEYLQEWAKKHPKKPSKVKRFLKGIRTGFMNKTK